MYNAYHSFGFSFHAATLSLSLTSLNFRRVHFIHFAFIGYDSILLNVCFCFFCLQTLFQRRYIESIRRCKRTCDDDSIVFVRRQKKRVRFEAIQNDVTSSTAAAEASTPSQSVKEVTS